jgi:hypothetical protein
MTPTVERQALDKLLSMFPDFDLMGVDWQRPKGQGETPGPWLIVFLGQRSEDGFEAWARHEYAIWKRTGAVHLVGADGAVIDPPIIEGGET